MQPRKLLTFFTLAATLLAASVAQAQPAAPTILAPPYTRYETPYNLLKFVTLPDGVAAGTVDATPVAAAMFTSGGAATYVIPPGTFSIDPQDVLTLPAGATLKGAGMGVTILTLESGRTGTGLWCGSNSTVRDLTIKGADAASTTGLKPATNATGVRVERVEFKDVEVGSALAAGNDGIAYTSCRFNSCSTFGIQTTGAAAGLMVVSCDFDTNGSQDIALQSSPVGGLIAGNRFNGTASGIVGTSPSKFAVIGNSFTSVTTPWSSSGGVLNTLIANNGISDPNSTVSGTVNNHAGRYYGTASPSSGTWLQGDVVWNRNPGALPNAEIGWIASAGGTSGTWQKFYRGQSLIVGTGTWDPASMADGAVTSKSDFNVPGAVLGNRVTVAAPYAVDAGVIAYASVVSADTCRVTLFNHSGGSVDFASGTWTLQVSQ